MAGLKGGDVDLAAVWRARFAAYEAGSDSVAAVCGRLGIPVANWYYWRKKLSVGEARPQAFTELVVAGAAPGGLSHGIEVALASGIVIRVGEGAGERELALVLRALGAC